MPNENPEMTKEQFKQEMGKVSEASIGLEMTNHILNCPSCANILLQANTTVIRHIEETNKLR